MSKNSYNGHTFSLEPHGPGYKVRVNGPSVNTLAGTFATKEQAIRYAMDRIDKPGQDEAEDAR